MAVWKMAVRSIKLRKGYSIMIFLMIAVVVFFGITAVNVLLAGDRILQDEHKERDGPDYAAFFINQQFSAEDMIFFQNYPGVTRVETRPVLWIAAYQNRWNGKEGRQFMLYADPSLEKGEILAPYADMAQGKIKTGDSVELAINCVFKQDAENEMKALSFSVTGPLIDFFWGGSMFGVQFLPLSQEDFDDFSSISGEFAFTEVMLYTEPGVDLGGLKSDVESATHVYWGLTHEESQELLLLVPKIISCFLMLIAAILVLVVLLTLCHTVVSSLESDYKTIGVLKGLGFENKQVLSFIFLHYLLLSCAGVVVGVGVSLLVQQPVLGFFLSFAGIPPKKLVFPEVIWGVALAQCSLVLLCSWFSARRVYRISPVRAISQGQAEVHFSRRFNLSLQRLFFLPGWLRLVVKQIVSKGGQYAVIFVVSVLFCYALVTLMGFYTVMDDPRSSTRLLGLPEEGLEIYIKLDDDKKPIIGINQALEDIEAMSKVKTHYECKMPWVKLNGSMLVLQSYSTFEGIEYPEPMSGRFPQYNNNEVMITPQLQKLYGLNLGNKITLGRTGDYREFIITGITSNVLDMGHTLITTLNAVSCFIDMPSIYVVVLENDVAASHVIASFNDKFEGLAQISKTQRYVDYRSGIRLGILGVATLLLIMTVLLITFITALVTQIAVYREQRDMGILKTTGYSTVQLRQQFAVRFLLVSAMGYAMGLILNLAFSDKMMSAVLGFYSYEGNKTLMTLLGPVVFLCGIITLLAWLATRRIRKIGLENLNTE
ncbi:MAG: ABC transporter permease [Peptococcaceae bacterium]|nr:ABC transporter permease [Peptococcaceae bacterium]